MLCRIWFPDVLFRYYMTSQALSLLQRLNLSTISVLIVEDNDGLRRMVLEVLRSVGFVQFVQARDAEEAIELMGAYNPDLMLLDWNLPGMSGVELVRALRQAAVSEDARFPNPRMPVVMLTGRHRSLDVTEARNAGVDEFVVKPFSTRSLLRAAASCLCRPRPFVIAKTYVGPCRRRHRDEEYAGLLRRADDIEKSADTHFRSMFQQTLSVELEGLRALMMARGGLHRETLDYLVERSLAAEQRALEHRLELVARATRSLKDYVAWFRDAADPEVLDVHLDSIRRLNDLRNEDTPEAVAIIRQLDALVSNRKKRRLPA